MARSFPEEFKWGVATSAYQIEGAVAEDGRGESIWDVYSHTPGRVLNGDNGDIAADHYHRFREDVALMKELGVDSYRFSVSWPRVIPRGCGEVNKAGIEFYRKLVEALVEVEIEPMVTLYHWDLPQALHESGGWLDHRSVAWFTNYAKVMKESLGDLVDLWTTLNEPFCSAFLGYGSGGHAPGLSDAGSSYVAAHHHLLAHHEALTAMRAMDGSRTSSYGAAPNLVPKWPASNSPEDLDAADRGNIQMMRLFLDGIFYGTYPDLIREFHERFSVADVIDVDELAEKCQPSDFLGVNYYNVVMAKFAPGMPDRTVMPGVDELDLFAPAGPTTDMGWAVTPEGLVKVLDWLKDEYPPIPIYVTENGAAYPDDVLDERGVVEDQDRIEYLRLHIDAMHQAIENGVNLAGYYVWSLLDNFEWSYGYSKKFGLIRVDPKTLERRMKKSGLWYRDFLAGGAVLPD